MSVQSIAWVSQAVVFPPLATLLGQRPANADGAPLTQGPGDALAPAQVTDASRRWARLGCLSAPVLGPILPMPRSWPAPQMLTRATDLVRCGSVAVLSAVAMIIAPPEACQSGAATHAPLGGLAGDCQAQQAVWRDVVAQAYDGVTAGLATGAVIVVAYTLTGAAVGVVQAARRSLYSADKPAAVRVA